MIQPLAARMRPRTLDEYVGQEKLMGQTGVLRRAIEKDNIPSMILWGPPGTGKTTLAMLIAEQTERPYFSLSAVEAGVKQIKEVLDKAKRSDFFDSPSPILFIDEIHRFNKAQQDSLLKAVERGTVTLIGATTENPSFEVNSALLSRCQVFVLGHLEDEQLLGLMNRALKEDSKLKDKNLELKETEAILQLSAGDARKMYNILEIVSAQSEDGDIVTNDLVKEVIQKNIASYDKSGEQHYDIISAFIKSIRGSDPNGAVYWLARMIEGGEDPKFICRRMIISASEDIGLANPNALLMANNCAQAVHNIGMPEGRIILSQCAIYLACSPKSNASYMAIGKAQQEVKKNGGLSVPLHLRNAPTKLMKNLDYGKDYKYSHDYNGNFAQQEYLPSEISGTGFFQPGNSPTELKYREMLKKLWKDIYNY